MITGAAPLTRGQAGPGHESVWTAEQIRERMADAADTLRRLPKPRGLERSLQSPWPDVIRDWLAYGWDPTHVRIAAPSPQAITRLDECLEWISPKYVTRDQRIVLWGRAQKLSWPRLAFLDAQLGKGRSERQLRNIRADGEARILSRLNGTPPRLVIPPPIGGGRPCQAPSSRAGSVSATKATRNGSRST